MTPQVRTWYGRGAARASCPPSSPQTWTASPTSAVAQQRGRPPRVICVRNPGHVPARLGIRLTLAYSRARVSCGAVRGPAGRRARRLRPPRGDTPVTITLDGSSLTVEKLVRIAREGEQVELDPAAARAHQGLPRHARGQDQGARDHVRHQHRHRRVQRDRARRRPGAAVPALPRLQPRRRHRRARADRGRARRHGGAHQRPRPRQLGQPAGDHADAGRRCSTTASRRS